jgi:predicted amidohydrolase YtcJ
MRTNRRDFVKAAGATAALAALGRPVALSAQDAPAADLVVTNGLLVTFDERRPEATAMAVRGGRVVAVGDIGEIRPLAGPATRMVDLKGRGVSPGLIDAHSHPLAFAVWNRDLRAVRTAEDLKGLEVVGTYLAGRCVFSAPEARLQ